MSWSDGTPVGGTYVGENTRRFCIEDSWYVYVEAYGAPSNIPRPPKVHVFGAAFHVDIKEGRAIGEGPWDVMWLVVLGFPSFQVARNWIETHQYEAVATSVRLGWKGALTPELIRASFKDCPSNLKHCVGVWYSELHHG